MEKIKIVQEAFEKAKELYWEEDKTVAVFVEFWKFSDGTEKRGIKVWLDKDVRDINNKPDHIFSSESFQELLDFLGIKDSEGDPRFTSFGGATDSLEDFLGERNV